MVLDFFAELVALLGELEQERIPYALAGAVALAIHGVPRATADIDLLVPPDAAERALGAARRRGFAVEALPMRLGDGTELRRVTKLEGEDALTLDLLLVHAGLVTVWESRERLATVHGPLWVVSREGLVRMKAAAGRDQDLADIRRLEELDR